MTTSRPALPKTDWLRLNGLLEQALAVEPDERAAWLAALPPDAATLRDLLRELLAEAHSPLTAARDRLGSSVARVAADALAAMRRERPGDRIGPWKLERLLAEGGMGDVWLAERADGVVQRTVALKLPRAEWVDRGLTLRIARERAILARLAHPHIAVLYDAGLGADGRPYLALEYVQGVPIDAWCRERPLREVLRLFVLLTRAVAHAHAQLVIHRDLKPSNVLVTADGTPKLLDFGISKLLEGDGVAAANESELTQLSGRRLTLAYAAPEQVLGEPVGVACDVYALGAMLFELLAGQRLHRHAQGRELEDEILRGQPRRPSDVATDRARARVLRGDLDAIVLHALRRDPAARYTGAAALADDLERHLAGRAVRARPDSRWYRLRKFVVRNAWPVAAGTAVVAALGGGLALALWQAQRATALTEFVLSLVRQADPHATRQTRAADLPMLASIEDKIDREFKGAADEQLMLRVTLAEAYRNRGEMMAARRVYQRAVDDAVRDGVREDLPLLTARVRASDTRLIVSTQASEQLDRAIDALRARRWRSAASDALLVDALMTRLLLQIAYGLPAPLPAERRLEAGREAEALAFARFGAGSREHLRVVNGMSRWRHNIEGAAAARRSLEQAVEPALRRSDGAQASAELRAAQAGLAALRCEEGIDAPGAIAALRSTIEQVRAAHGDSSIELEVPYLALGRCQQVLRDPAAALGAHRAALEVASARERPPSTQLMRRAQDALDAAMQARQLTLAARLHRQVLDNAEAIPEPALRERLTGAARIVQVCLLAQSGESDAAVRAAAPLVARSDAVYAQVRRLTPRQGELWTCLAQAQRELGRHDEALKTIATFLERCSTTPLAPTIALNCRGEALIERALVELDTGRVADAQATLAERQAMSRDTDPHPTYALMRGRVLLASGQAVQAIEPLQRHHKEWVALQPDSPYTAEALYWLGQAHSTAGQVRGRTMIDEARPLLARSPVASHRRLAAEAAAR
jgi:tetratricopeptide (TPR) repeat protein/tRNA A-37 threonylcarbamoyl transferase component Bud32